MNGIKDTIPYLVIINFLFEFSITSPLNRNHNGETGTYYYENSPDETEPWRKELEFWLDDFEPKPEIQENFVYNYGMQGDDPGGGATEGEDARSGPLVDWAVPPQPRKPGSSSWLMDDPENPERLGGGAVCILHRRAYGDGEVFTYEHHTCLCDNGDISCKVVSGET